MRDGYRATVGDRVRTIRAAEDHPAGVTGTVMGLSLFVPGYLMVHLDTTPNDEVVKVRRMDVVVIHEAKT